MVKYKIYKSSAIDLPRISSVNQVIKSVQAIEARSQLDSAPQEIV